MAVYETASPSLWPVICTSSLQACDSYWEMKK